MSFEKKLMIIYNPNSGKKKKVRTDIENFFDVQGIKFEFHETKGFLDALNFVKDFEIDQYDGVVAVGGDGTIHEVINGLMRRADKKKVPIGLIPNGTGNDTCGGLLIDTLAESLNYIKKGDLVKVDVLRVLMDYPKEEDIKGDVNKHLRYSIINSNLCLTANCAKNAGKWKSVFGQEAYSIQTVIELIKRRQEKFDIEYDDGTSIHSIKDVES